MPTHHGPPRVPYWEIQPGESSRAFSAFVAYRSLPAGSRSIREASRGESTRQWERWSASHDWGERCRQYDDWLAKEFAEAMAEQRRRQASEVAELAGKAGKAALQVVAGSIRKIHEGMFADPRSGPLSPLDTLRMLQVASSLLGLQVADDGEDNDPLDLSDEDLARIINGNAH